MFAKSTISSEGFYNVYLRSVYIMYSVVSKKRRIGSEGGRCNGKNEVVIHI